MKRPILQSMSELEKQAQAAWDYAEQIRERLPRLLQEAREEAPASRYALARRSKVSRDMIGDIESGDAVPTLHLTARIAHGLGMKLWVLVRRLEG